MKRRDFLGTAAAAGALSTLGRAEAWAQPTGTGGGTLGTAAATHPNPATARHGDPFQCDYAPHFGMFRENGGEDLVGQLQFMADHGFRSLEDNGMTGRSVADQERIAAEMARLGMRMGVFVAHTIYWREPNLAGGDQALRDEFLAEIRAAVDVAKRVNAQWMTVVPGHVDLRLHPDFQTANVVESLKQAAAILEPHGLIMVLEPLNPHNHPGLF